MAKEKRSTHGISSQDDPSKPANFATIYEKDLEYISKCILDYPDMETGGDFFGFWNNLGLPVVLYVTGPGEHSYRTSSFFKQDLNFLVSIGNHVHTHFGLQHIGSWHSHHQLSLAVPSSYDCNTMVNAITNNNLEKFFMILGNITVVGGTTINGFLFDKKNQTHYTETEWNILKTENVIAKAIKQKLEPSLYYIPKTNQSKLQDLKIVIKNENTVFRLDFEPHSWLGSKKGKQELKEIFSWFSSKYTNAKMFISQSNDIELKGDGISVKFPHDFPNSFPRIKINGNQLITEERAFEDTNGKAILNYIISTITSLTTDKIKNNK